MVSHGLVPEGIAVGGVQEIFGFRKDAIMHRSVLPHFILLQCLQKKHIVLLGQLS